MWYRWREQPNQTESKETRKKEVVGDREESVVGRVVGNQITECGRLNNSLPTWPCPKFQDL